MMQKPLFVFVLCGFVGLATPSIATQTARTKTVTLAVENMTCGTCPITVRWALKKVDGVTEAKADLDTHSATVTFDPDQTNVQALMRATADAGYPSKLAP